MSHFVESLEQMYSNLVIDDEEEGGIVVAANEVVVQKQTYMLVGKFLTEKNININVMQNVMASVWRPKEGMEVHEMGGLRFSFIFFHQMDVQKVIEGGPWSFEQAMLVFHQVAPGEDPLLAKLQEVDIWVQIYDIPHGFLSENILRSVGSAIGRYIKSGPGTFEGGWKQYVRIRVAINVEKPLKRRMKIKREGDSWSWLNFKYERLGTFCFVCGVLGHSERDCNIVYANPDKVVEKAYGPWLRAPARNVQNNAGSRWLRNTKVGEGKWGSQGSTAAHGGGGQGSERFMETEGVVREKSGDNEEIRVKSREMRNLIADDVVMTNVNRAEDNVIDDRAVIHNDNVIIDPKRKRTAEDLLGENGGADKGINMESTQQTILKNLQLAGPGVQARLGLLVL